MSVPFLKIVTPLIMGLLFFAVLTPIGMVLRLVGKDPLRLCFDRAESSYWIARPAPGERQASMTRQW